MLDKLMFPVLLQIAGVAVIIAEIILPSGGVLSILALSVFGYSLYHVFTSISYETGIIFTILDLLLIPVFVIYGVKLLAKSPVTLKTELSSESGVVSQDQDYKMLLDMQGTAVTDLRPAGIAKIDGKRQDVVTEGEYIEKGESIIVTSVTGNQIIVKHI